ncbi:MAG: chemotaxis protein CheA [Gammaproteobacteria bacterium]|nr:chemotaxis protein CheA [Gammaproteobacteria bacterium]
MAIDMAQFHQVFFEESFEGLDVMESGLLNMDAGKQDSEEINAIFRAAHSIKGGSGTFGFDDISTFTHVMETLLDEMRDGRRPITSQGVAVLLSSVDVVREMMSATQEKKSLDGGRVQAQQNALKDELNNPAGAPAEITATEIVTDTAEDQPRGWHIIFRPLPHMLRTGNDPLRLIRELSALGELHSESDISRLPSLSTLEPEDCYISWDLHLHSDTSRSEIDEVFDWVEGDCELIIMPLLLDVVEEEAKTQAPVEPEVQKREEERLPEPVKPERKIKGNERRQTDRRVKERSAGNGGSGSIRVDIDKIDALINMVGELVITQSMLSMLGEEFSMDRVERLQDGLSQLERHTRVMQESVMQIRMLPISFAFSRFPRLVHDMSAKMDKMIELKMIGENTEVDKTVIEIIGDPLVHLVRNSLDHGIEIPEERIAAGKPETGTVELKASHRGGNILIEIRDDGRGLDRDKILSKGIEKGLVNEDANLNDGQIYDLIFKPGFSTADVVSDVSGRGVGMDVVQRNINELGGSIEIQSTIGKGSAIIIRLPLTLAILDGQTITVGNESYIIPLVSIVESIQLRPEMINLMAGRGEAFKLRDDYLPIIRLHEVFGVESARTTELTDGLLVVVEAEGCRCGLFVDELMGQQQVVIKSLEANYQRVQGVSGATILGDGSVALILDVPGVIRLSGQCQGASLKQIA